MHISAFGAALRTPDLRRKILFSLGLIALYRLGSVVPTPGVDYSAVQRCLDVVQGNSVYAMINLFSGGALLQLSIFALGIMPYITASIILQLMTVVIPRLETLKQDGQAGRHAPGAIEAGAEEAAQALGRTFEPLRHVAFVTGGFQLGVPGGGEMEQGNAGGEVAPGTAPLHRGGRQHGGGEDDEAQADQERQRGHVLVSSSCCAMAATKASARPKYSSRGRKRGRTRLVRKVPRSEPSAFWPVKR